MATYLAVFLITYAPVFVVVVVVVVVFGISYTKTAMGISDLKRILPLVNLQPLIVSGLTFTPGWPLFKNSTNNRFL